MSGAVLEEIDEVLRRPKFRRSIAPQVIDEILAILGMASQWCFPNERVQDCRDVGDDIHLELALDAQADVIVSSDADLLSMNPWRHRHRQRALVPGGTGDGTLRPSGQQQPSGRSSLPASCPRHSLEPQDKQATRDKKQVSWNFAYEALTGTPT